MKKLLPLLIALLGLGAGVGAGLALKPAPEAGGRGRRIARRRPTAEAAASERRRGLPGRRGRPLRPGRARGEEEARRSSPTSTMDKPFVVPVFAGEKVMAMVVVSLSVETDTEAAHTVEAVKPRLRDSFLKVMFRHANSGGFDGSFTTGRKMEDLKSALLEAAREVMAETPVEEVLITEIARQES